MSITETLSALGCSRPVWIDDVFNETAEKLARMLLQNLDLAKSCGFHELQETLVRADFLGDATLPELIEKLLELGEDRRDEIKEQFFADESVKFASDELSSQGIGKVCELLGVNSEDRWNFDEAEAAIPKLCADGDESISYIVDLNETGGSSTRGLEILKLLWAKSSKGVAFLLTHETSIDGEANKEVELRGELLKEEGLAGIPICVIAKERFDEQDDDKLKEALKISIKRAGLRRSLTEVVLAAEGFTQRAFVTAAESLLNIVPEQLEAHVFQRGYKEGVSDLHVVERILTSHMSQELRRAFGTDKSVLESAKRLRSLRAIKLASVTGSPDPNLAAFRRAEIWESEDLINASYAPIACGDVFEADSHETSVKSLVRKFILLGQPCDIALRPTGKDRSSSTGFFMPLKRLSAETDHEENPRLPVLPCHIDGASWACDFRAATSAKLAVLDLSSLRNDGRIRVDEAQTAPSDLLDGQLKVFPIRTAAATRVLNGQADLQNSHLDLQLTFSSDDKLKHFHCPILAESSKASGGLPELPRRITWRLRRCGRIRMPYAAALLDQYLKIINRQAFDLDYMSPGF